MAQPSMSFASCSGIVLARDFEEKIPSYLHHQGENGSQRSQEKGFIKISTNRVIDNIQKFTHLASAREGRSCETGQSPPVNEDIRDNYVRKDINLLHGNDVRCIVTHLLQNSFLPEKEQISQDIAVLCYLYSQFRAHSGQYPDTLRLRIPIWPKYYP